MKKKVLDIWAEFASRVFLHLSVDVRHNSGVKELVDVASSIFMRWHVLVDLLDIHIHEKPIVVDICWVSKRRMHLLVCNNTQKSEMNQTFSFGMYACLAGSKSVSLPPSLSSSSILICFVCETLAVPGLMRRFLPVT